MQREAYYIRIVQNAGVGYSENIFLTTKLVSLAPPIFLWSIMRAGVVLVGVPRVLHATGSLLHTHCPKCRGGVF